MGKQLKELARLLEAEGLLAEAAPEVYEIECGHVTADSRRVLPGDVFVCKGAAFKPAYLESAAAAGAAAYIARERYAADIPCMIVTDVRRALAVSCRWAYGCPGDGLYITGITGTKGKTTTAYILRGILDEAYGSKTALFSTSEICIGETSRATHLTTPEPPELQACFEEAVNAGCTHVVMEVSSQAMKMSRVYGEHFGLGLFLNVDEDHIGGQEHATLDEYVACKTAFLRQCDTAIVYKGTRFLDRVLAACEGRPTILYGYDASSDAVISNVDSGAHGSAFRLTYQGRQYDFVTSMAGRFNVENFTAAIIAAMCMGIDAATIQRAIANVYVPGRMDIREYGGFHIVIDYAHNRLSFQNLYQAVEETFDPERIIAVFGCAGERSDVRKRDIGIMAQQYADIIYLTADDPGFEKVTDICGQIAAYISKPCKVITDREAAVAAALSEARPGDAVIIAGKGSETTQRVRGSYEPYISDAGAVDAWIRSHGQSR